MNSLWILTPFGVDFFCLGRKYLVYNMVTKNLKVKYRRSILGVMWTLLVPLGMAGIYYFVFQVIMQVKTEHYLLMILSGILPWNFFSQSLGENTVVIVDNVGLVTKVPIPVHSLPFIGSVTNFITLLLSLPVIILASYINGVGLQPSMVVFFVYIAMLFIIGYSLSTVLAIAYAYLRDLRHIISVLLSLWFFATPIVYNVDMIPENYRWLVFANPVGCIFKGIQNAMVRGLWPSTADFVTATGWTCAALLLATLTTKKLSKKMVELL